MIGRELSQVSLAEFLGVSQMQIVHWRKDGCPCEKRGGKHYYDSAAVVEWLRERAKKSAEAPEAAEERARLMRAQAELKEMDIAQRRGDLVEASRVEKIWSELIIGLRARILQLPPRGAELSGMRPAEAEARLKRLVYDALSEMANAKFPVRKRASRKKPAGPAA